MKAPSPGEEQLGRAAGRLLLGKQRERKLSDGGLYPLTGHWLAHGDAPLAWVMTTEGTTRPSSLLDRNRTQASQMH